MASETNFIFSNSIETIKCSPDKIVYIKADGNYSTMYFTSGEKYEFTMQLGRLKELLMEELEEEAEQFVRVGKSLIINFNYIFKIDTAKGKLELCDKHLKHHKLEASQEALKALKKLIKK